MKTILKRFSLMVMAALLTLSLAACGGSGNNPGSTASKGGESSTGDTVNLNLVKDGTLIMGTNAEFPPFESKEGDGFVGIDVELMQAIADKLGLEFQVEDMDFNSLTAAFGKIDVIAAGFTVDPEREQTCDFTQSYFNASQTVIVTPDSTIATVEDLDGKKIGVQNGTTGYDTAKEVTDESNVTQYNNGSLAVEALVSGKIDAVIIDKNPANAYKDQHGDKIKLVEGLFEEEEYALAVKKGNKELLDALNKALAELKADGTFDKIVEKYIPSK